MKKFVVNISDPVIELPNTHSQESLISFMSCGLFDEYRDEPVYVHLTKEEKEYIDTLKKKQL